MNDDMTQDTIDALAMIGTPVVAFEKPQDIIVRNDSGEYIMVTTPAWVKFAVGLRHEMKRLKGSRLAVFMCLCLHINDKNECYPTMPTIANETGYSERECMRAVEELESDKLISVIRKHRSANTYSINAFASFGDGNTPITLASKVTQETSRDVEKVTLTMSKKSPQEEPIKQNQENTTPPTSKPKTPQQLMIDTLCSVMGLEVNLNAARVARLASELVRMTITPTQIESVYGASDTAWWYQQDWRGKKGQKPTESAIRETLAQAANSGNAPAAKVIRPPQPKVIRAP